jgi:hypothetical protein
MTPKGKAFTPSWVREELDAIRELMKIGFLMSQRVIDTPKTEDAESGPRD